MTWKDIIRLIQQMLGCSQVEIANHLKVNPSTISRLKQGKQATLHFSPNQIYEVLFNPSNPESLISTHFNTGHNENELLYELKAAIKELNLTIETEQFGNDYKESVMQMLRAAKNSQLPKASLPQNSNDSPSTQKVQNQQCEEIQSNNISCEFYQSCEHYGIGNFIEQNPFDSLFQYQLEDAIYFIGHIKTWMGKNNSLGRDADLYQHICHFTDDLLQYVRLLKLYSRNMETFSKNSVPEKISQDIVPLRDRLISSHKSIISLIEEEREKCKIEQKKEFRRIWEENSCKGTLSTTDI